MSQIRLARTTEIEKMLEKVKPFFELNSDSEILKTLASLGLEVFEKRIINHREEEEAEEAWSNMGQRQIAKWAEEEDPDGKWDLSNLKPAPPLPKQSS